MRKCSWRANRFATLTSQTLALSECESEALRLTEPERHSLYRCSSKSRDPPRQFMLTPQWNSNSQWRGMHRRNTLTTGSFEKRRMGFFEYVSAYQSHFTDVSA